MSEFTTYGWVIIGIGVAAVLTPVVLHLASRGGQRQITDLLQRYMLYRGTEFPTIHATSGVPILQQLVAGMVLDAKKMGTAEILYAAGLAQFNHYVNNRDGALEESRREMESLSNYLSPSEVSLAEGVGHSLAEATGEEQRAAAEARYDLLSPQAQSYARHKEKEIDAQRRIARDLAKNVPRTDFTSVKARIASGDVRLDSILSELPIYWQHLRTLNDKVERQRVAGRPPKREFLHVIFMTREWGPLEDKCAERDGDWIVSDKHNMIAPYQDPVPRCVFLEEGKPPVQKGELVIINQDPSSEWDTEFWRKDGRLDQVYLRARSGTTPEQLRRAHRRRQINRTGWILGSLMLAVDIVLVILRYL